MLAQRNLSWLSDQRHRATRGGAERFPGTRHSSRSNRQEYKPDVRCTFVRCLTYGRCRLSKLGSLGCQRKRVKDLDAPGASFPYFRQIHNSSPFCHYRLCRPERILKPWFLKKRGFCCHSSNTSADDFAVLANVQR